MLTDFLLALSQLWQLTLPPPGREAQQNRGKWLFSDSSLCKKTERARHSHSLDSQRILALIPASDLSLTQLYSGGLLGTHPPPPLHRSLKPSNLSSFSFPATLSHLVFSARLHCAALHCTARHWNCWAELPDVNEEVWPLIDRSLRSRVGCVALGVAKIQVSTLHLHHPQKHHPHWLVLWPLLADRIEWGRKEHYHHDSKHNMPIHPV